MTDKLMNIKDASIWATDYIGKNVTTANISYPGGTMDDDILFAITVEDLQEFAMDKIGRTLTEEELHIAKKGLEWGLLTDIETVYHTIVTEMI